MASLWQKLFKFFSRPEQPSDSTTSTTSSRRQSIENSSSTSSPATTQSEPDNDSSVNGDAQQESNPSNNKPRPTKQKSVGRSSGMVSEKTLKELKEKYRTSEATDGDSNAPRRPKKKSKMHPSSRSTRRSGSLRKAVLMQEEVKHVMMLDDVRASDNDGNTPLHRVSLLGNYEAVSLLCKRAPDIVNRLNNIFIMLRCEAQWKSEKRERSVGEAKRDREGGKGKTGDTLTRLQNGMSALHYASNAHCVNVLIWWGASIDIKSSSGKTPLYCAVERGTSPDAVEALLQRGAKVNQKSRDEGWAPLHVAAMRGLVQIVELLLEWSADVDVKDKRRSTSLHLCAGVKSRESEEICRCLIHRRAKVSPRDINGTTPLHMACGAGNTGVLSLILEKMCKNMPDALDLVDTKGCTAYHYAAMGGHTECIEVLKRDLPICELWLDDLGLSYSSWALVRGHFVSDFYPSGRTGGGKRRQKTEMKREKRSGGRGTMLTNFLGVVPYCADFISGVNEESSSDVVFMVEGLPVFAHRILCYTSPFLAKLIDVISPPNDIGAHSPPVGDAASNSSSPHSTSHSPHEGLKPVIDLKGMVSHKMFGEILQFMYTSKVSKDSDWTQLWFAAIKFELLRLQQLCEKELGGNPLRDRSPSTVSKRTSTPSIPQITPPKTPPATHSFPSTILPTTQASITPIPPVTTINSNTMTPPTTSIVPTHTSNSDSNPPDPSPTIVSDSDFNLKSSPTSEDSNNNKSNTPNNHSSDTTSDNSTINPTSTTASTTVSNDASNNASNATFNTASNNANITATSSNNDTNNNASFDTSNPANILLNNPADISPLHATSTPLRRRTTSRKRSNSSVIRMQMGVDPQIDYIHGMSLSLRRFVGNPMFHDMILVCAEEQVHAHKVIVKKRSPSFFLALSKNLLAEHTNMHSNETIFHFDDITKGAMMSLMEYIYCGGFHSKIEPEDAWVLYNFVVKHGVICAGLKERVCYLFYNVLSPDNLLDLVALNRYGFTINTLPYNPADSARYAKAYSNKEGSPSNTALTIPSSWGAMGSPPTTTTTITANSPNIIPNTSNMPNSSTISSDPNYRASINLPNAINRNSMNRNSITINRLPSPNSFHTANQEILLSILKYASKKVVSTYVMEHNKKNPTIKLLQTELRKHKTEPEMDTTKLWKDRRKEVKAFAKRKKLQATESLGQRKSL